MKLVRSFDEFVGESVLNEATDKFKLQTRTPNSADGEVANFKLVLREFDPQKQMADLAVGSAMQKPEFSKFAQDTNLIGFIKVTKERDSGFLTPRDLIKAIVIFKKAEGFDVTKATPLVTVNNSKFYNVEDAPKMKATETAIVQKVTTEIQTPEPKETPKPKEAKQSEYSLVEKIQANAEVLAFLKEKLLNGANPKFLKANTRVSEVKGVQALISKFTLADKKTPTTAATYIKKSGIDGIYGDNTGGALGWITPDTTKPQLTITADVVEHLAKWCTYMGMDRAAVEKVFNDNIIVVKQDDSDPKSGPKYYFVNKGWTYSEENDPYKTK